MRLCACFFIWQDQSQWTLEAIIAPLTNKETEPRDSKELEAIRARANAGSSGRRFFFFEPPSAAADSEPRNHIGPYSECLITPYPNSMQAY